MMMMMMMVVIVTTRNVVIVAVETAMKKAPLNNFQIMREMTLRGDIAPSEILSSLKEQ